MAARVCFTLPPTVQSAPRCTTAGRRFHVMTKNAPIPPADFWHITC
ncbi:unknown protein [Cronobacter turicensis z3032]|uniref:Uncharacterized protein n=1 Tax=Cronobacter turicensis (strain DSM 18703 / CCUG 55852 / LMG 23827 / z3032) TaxID=693216 RepID=C9XUW0_CROTZ|nr:unknown protein [Cronobacter turicensis z3032]